MSEPTLEFIGVQPERLTGDMGGPHDDVAVLTSIVLRQDATLTALLAEVPGMNSQISRSADRVRRLEH